MKTDITLAELQLLKGAIAPTATTALGLVNRKISDIQIRDNHKISQWNRYCAAFGMRFDQFGGTFIFQGRRYEITGLHPGAPKYCIEAKRLPDGKSFRFPRQIAQTAVPKPKAASAA